ncbi:MAG TPA: PQQ-dependent sugar dehydrogenase [Vicinamibacterales bacterium]|nr:PQQ-dependent sugar dehydrogenase [Vicinamibacterales bacterium]
MGLKGITFFLLSTLLGSPASAQQIRSTLFAAGFTDLIGFIQDPTDPAVQFVIEQTGHIKVLVNGQVQPDDFLDLSGTVVNDGERGLLGFTFAPDYASSGRVFVMFVNADSNSVVARFTRSEDNALRANPDSRFDLIWPGGTPYIPQPFTNHKGGNLAFGPDGYLYFGTGDGGAGFDPYNLAQDPQSLLGKMLRLDVAVPDDHPTGYEIPPTNPFAGSEIVLNEIWALGLRNPWRWSFDDPARGGTGALIIADVGQDAWEEINYEWAGQGGRNYGWRVREGAHDLITDPPPFSDLTDPIYEYEHPIGFCITGGYVYRGTALGAAFFGRYFFADFITGMLWSGRIDDASQTMSDIEEHQTTAGGGGQGVVSFGLDANGELYTVNRFEGAIYRLELDPTPPTTPFVPSDFIVWNNNSGNWSVLPASNSWSEGETYQWGVPGDVPVRADFDGDGRPDLVSYRPSNGIWYILPSSSNYAAANWIWFQWGNPGDIPMAGDYDGDGKADLVIYRPSNGIWYMRFSGSGYSMATWAWYQWGVPGDQPITGDFDGDHIADLIVYRPSGGMWYVRYSSDGYSYANFGSYQWGVPGDVAVPADYDGDGRTDLAVYRPTDGIWFLLYSTSNYSYDNWQWFQWGQTGDIPAPADYDGDGTSDIVAWRPSTGDFFVLYTGNPGQWQSYHWGEPGDVPVIIR